MSVTGSPPSERTPSGEAAKRTTGASVLRGTAWSTIAKVLPQVWVLVTSVVAARFLGPNGLGRQSFIAFVALSTTMLFTHGLSFSLMRYIGEELGADRPESVLDLVRWAWRLTGGAAVLGAAFLLTIAATGADPSAAWVLAGFGSAFGILHAVPSAVLIGAQRWREATIVGLVTGTISVPATIAVLSSGGGITGVFAVEAVVTAANLAFTMGLARRFQRTISATPTKNRTVRRRAARYAAWSTLGVVLTLIVFRRSEFFFLDLWSADSEIAIYSIAFAAINALTLFFEANAATLVPAIATLHGAGESARIRSAYRRSSRLILMLALPATAGVLAVGPEVIRLVYGSEYSGTEPVLRLMTVVLPVVPVMYIGNSLLAGLGYVWPSLAAGAVAAAINVGLAVLLIPQYDAVGAALANGGAQVVVAVLVGAYCARVVGGNPIDANVAVRTIAASALGGLLAWGIVSIAPGIIGVAGGIVAGLTTFMLAGRILGILAIEDAEWLLQATGAKSFTRVIAPACHFLCPAAGRPA